MANRSVLQRTMLGLAMALTCNAPAWGAEQNLGKGEDGDVMFVTPSGNIGCHYIPKGGTTTYQPMTGGPELQCDRVAPAYVTVFMDHKGKAIKTEKPGEQGCCSLEQKLEYGNSWSEGPFTCLSASIGLTCTSTDGHGFFISRSKIKVH